MDTILGLALQWVQKRRRKKKKESTAFLKTEGHEVISADVIPAASINFLINDQVIK